MFNSPQFDVTSKLIALSTIICTLCLVSYTDISLIVSYVVLVVCFICALFFLKGCIEEDGKQWLCNGNFWMIVSFFLIFLFAPFARGLTQVDLPTVFARRDWQVALPQVNVLCGIAILSLMAGSYFSLLRSKREFLPPAISFARPQILSGLSLVLALFWTIYYMRWAFSQGNISTVLLGSRTQQALIGVIKTDGYGVDAIYGVSGILLLYIAQHRIIQDHKTDVKLRILVSAYLLTLIPSLLNGDRSKFIFFVLVLVMVYVNTGMKIGRNRIIAIVLILPIVITAPRVYRSSVEGIKAKSFNNLISVKTISDTFTQEDLAMAPTFSILVNSFEKNEDYLHGNSYLALISKPLPRKLWPNKPIPFDVEMTRKIFPIESKYVGFSFSGLSEPYANFGYFGVVVFFFIIGFLNRRLLNRARNMNISSVLLNSWTAGFMFILARGNLTTDMQRFAFPLISGLILISRKKNLIND